MLCLNFKNFMIISHHFAWVTWYMWSHRIDCTLLTIYLSFTHHSKFQHHEVIQTLPTITTAPFRCFNKPTSVRIATKENHKNELYVRMRVHVYAISKRVYVRAKTILFPLAKWYAMQSATNRHTLASHLCNIILLLLLFIVSYLSSCCCCYFRWHRRQEEC